MRETRPKPPFDYIVLINLDRRKDRLKQFVERKFPWPITRISAVDGSKIGAAKYFTQGDGAWGCLRSWINVLETFLIKHGDNPKAALLGFEDDAAWEGEVAAQINHFLRHVPDDWDQLMLGGQHQSEPTPVNEHVVRCWDTERTHAMALRPTFAKALLHEFYTCSVHCDWLMGTLQQHWKVYAPTKFIFSQAAGPSDISGNHDQLRSWNPPSSRRCILLTAPREVADELAKRGWHRGYWRDAFGRDIGLKTALASEFPIDGIKGWYDAVNWECASYPGWIPTCWHDKVTVEMLRKVASEVYVIKGETVEECLNQWEHIVAVAAQAT